MSDVSEELHAGAVFLGVVIGGKGKIAGSEVGGEFGILEGDFVGAGFVLEDGEIIVEGFNVVKGPGVVKEVAVSKSIFEAVGGEVRLVVVGDGIEMIIGDFARKDAVFFELFHDGAGVADDLLGAFFGGFLDFVVTVHEVDTMFEGGGGDIVEETGESLFLVVGEMPNNEGDTDAVVENGGFVFVLVEVAVADTAGTIDMGEALHLRGGEVFE